MRLVAHDIDTYQSDKLQDRQKKEIHEQNIENNNKEEGSDFRDIHESDTYQSDRLQDRPKKKAQQRYTRLTNKEIQIFRSCGL